MDQEDKRASILRFALSGLAVGGSPTAEDHVLANFSEFPHLASVASRYLASLGFKETTANRILDFLESEHNIHEWQQMWLLEYFRIEGASLGSQKPRIKAILEDTNRHPLVRAVAAEILALHGDPSDGEDF
ncbi:MAG: hypothetical protein IH899_05940 [Planctomycetes bacterium]|nr:hypothetical protein [Planctomycetota bacterium]